ncbi:MAG: Abi family protein [Dehalococcoidia bacterium]
MTADYTKPPLTYAGQVALLQSRGLAVNSTDDAIQFLQHVNYYRFSAYCIPFQKLRDVFLPNSTFEKIIELYRLDEELRNALLALLSPIEIFLRTRIVYELSHGWGAFAHYDPALFRDKAKHAQWIASLEEEINRGKETFLEHYKTKYNVFPRLPLWMACEIMSMGSLSNLYSNLLPDPQRRICSILEIHHNVFGNWMHVITYLRNTCAHHGRLWNRELAIRPRIPDKDKQWTTLGLDNKHLFASVAVAEWICHKTQLPTCNIEPVHEIMRMIAAIDARFTEMMGVPGGRTIGLCWKTK